MMRMLILPLLLAACGGVLHDPTTPARVLHNEAVAVLDAAQDALLADERAAALSAQLECPHDETDVAVACRRATNVRALAAFAQRRVDLKAGQVADHTLEAALRSVDDCRIADSTTCEARAAERVLALAPQLPALLAPVKGTAAK